MGSRCFMLLNSLRELASMNNKRAYVHINDAPASPNKTILTYVNNTEMKVVVTRPNGTCLIIEPTTPQRPEHAGLFHIMEDLRVSHNSFTLSKYIPESDPEFKQFQANANSMDSSCLHFTILGSDIISEKTGVFLPDLMVTIGAHVHSEILENKAVQSKFFRDGQNSAVGKRFRYYSKDKGNKLYLVYANEVIEMSSEIGNHKDDTLEIYKTNSEGMCEVESIKTLDEILKGGEESAIVCLTSTEALSEQKRLSNALEDYESLKEQNRILTDKLQYEKQKSITDSSKAKATIWTKASAAISSVITLFGSLWRSFVSFF